MTASAPVIAALDDIDSNLATRAFSGTSFSPKERGETRRKEYMAAVNGLYADMHQIATTEHQQQILAAEMERYRQGYITRLTAYLHSHSNVMSAMIAGPARFPVDRNRKRLDSADRKASELCEWSQKARDAIKRKILDARPQEMKDAEEHSRTRSMVLDSLTTIAACDAGTAGYSRSLILGNLAGRIERMAHNGDVDAVRTAIDTITEYNKAAKKPAFTTRHKIWTFPEIAGKIAARRIESSDTEPETLAETNGVRVVVNPAVERVQIIFPGRPSADVIARLKSEAWRWSPSNGAWQRQITPAAKQSAQRILEHTA